ncbi:MAG TPA: hypothetical protein VNE63_07215 [Candidatus Acidoferrales bacterium]|nr:hypothetical protein [Candidatus Acidoferrales bacterium]
MNFFGRNAPATGASGIEQIIEIKLTPEEKAALDKSSASVRELVNVLGV